MAVLNAEPGARLGSGAAQRLIAAGVVLAVCYYAQPVVITFLCSVFCAVLLEPAVSGLTRLRLPRGLAAFLVVLLALALLIWLGGLFYGRAAAFAQELPRYESTIRETVDRVRQRVQNLEGFFSRLVPAERQQQIVQAMEARRPRTQARQPVPAAAAPPPVPEVRLQGEGFFSRYVFPQLKFFYEFVFLASFIPFLVYFMLSWKQQMRGRIADLFPDENRLLVDRILHGIGTIVRGFLVGNFLIGFLLAVLSALIFWYLRIPFPFMMGTISGFLSIIPYVGLPLALVPPVFAALGVYTSVSAYVIIMSIVAGLHLLALNLLYPKLVGSRLHLNPVAVTLAIMVWGWMWGALGLVLAIPITAGLKAVCDNVPALQGYARLLGD